VKGPASLWRFWQVDGIVKWNNRTALPARQYAPLAVHPRFAAMPAFNYLYRLPTLLILLLILPQCTEKSSSDYVEEGHQYTEHQKYSKAEKAYLKAIEKGPDNPDGYYGLGGIYNYFKKFDKAAEAFKKAIRLDPTHFNAYYSLGYTYEQMGKKREAEKQYQTSKRLKKKMEEILKKNQEKS